MHELAVMQSVVALCEREAAERGFRRVRSINLAVGAVSGIVPGCMFEFFPAAARGSVAEGARLETGLRLFRRGPRRRVPPLRGLGLPPHTGQGVLYRFN